MRPTPLRAPRYTWFHPCLITRAASPLSACYQHLVTVARHTEHTGVHRIKLMLPYPYPTRARTAALATQAKDEFSAWTAAYRATQPKPVYAQEEDEEEEEGA